MFECQAQWEWHRVSRKRGGTVGQGGRRGHKIVGIGHGGRGGGERGYTDIAMFFRPSAGSDPIYNNEKIHFLKSFLGF